mgnify:FL=1|tara:strand:- start:1488 stop:1661 length:174 start_codon:yes stop_codon:yes gene_type:complete
MVEVLEAAKERLRVPSPHEISEHNFNFNHPATNVEEEDPLTYSHLGKKISVLSDTEQ